jgi:rfaE bifunctional protein nucleotidyltransferase chain/domain
MGALIQINELDNLRTHCNQQNKTIALANGCFDIIHIGHVRYLKEAKELADILVVAINSDESVKKIKGNNRPLFPEKERAELLCAIRYVDYVVIFHEMTVEIILRTLRPDFHCKGSEYTEDSVPEKAISDEMHIKTCIVGGPKIHSSSALIQKIEKKHSC